MTTPQNRQLSDEELELLSAYIDNQLTAAERGALEQRLGREPALRAALDELRGTVAVLRELTPLATPRFFGLDPAAFAPRPAPLFGWLRLGATLASVLLAITFAVDFAGQGRLPAATSGGAPAAAAPTAASNAQRNALLATEAPAAMSAPAGGAAEATAAPAAAPEGTAAPAAPAPAAAPTSAPAAEAFPEPTAAPEPPMAAQAPSPTAEATRPAVQSADTNVTAAAAPTTTAPPAVQPTPIQPQQPGYSAPPAGGAAGPPPTSSGLAPRATQPEQQEPPSAAPQIAIQPLRLVEFGLAGLALTLGLAALWVRRRGR